MKRFSSLIVDPESAVLGYREEKQIPMTADHRSICKFDTPEDSNYALLRNALAATVSKIMTAISDLKLKQRRESIKTLKKYLDVSDVLDDDFVNVCESRMHGSCGWILAKASYLKWRDGKSVNDRTLWIKGRPATGKSVLAGYVIDQFNESGQACSYFFFKHGDKSKSSLGRCLRSLAFQMASSNAEVSDAILGIQADGVCFDRVDERTLWRILFHSGIFQTTMTRHYWVIDALDECSNPLVFLHATLSKLNESIPLRIFVTCRDTVDLDQGFSVIPPNLVQSLPISTTDTEPDLRLLVEKRTQALRFVDPDDRGILAEKILNKSKGSFLWTILLLEELQRCHGRNEINQILKDVPSGMEALYKRILDCMSQAARGKELAKTILMWAAYAVRPMTISELDGALTLDMHDSFPRLEESIAALCGQLVIVDKYGRVKMVHETAREFLVAGGLDSEFSFEESKAHTRMAQVCLNYLVGEEMKPPRNSRRRSSAYLPAKRLHFAAYAYTAYSYHLSRADPLAARTFQLVLQFLRSNILTWIETIAETRNLNHLICASEHLKTYVHACVMERSPLDPQIRGLRQWATDLARIPRMFANALMVSPSAIYSLIPPFCPTKSMVYNTGASGRRLAVLGASNKQWDDRLLCIDFRQGQPRALRYGDEFLAIGLSSGTVALYYAQSYQEYKVLEHGEGVNFIAFNPNPDMSLLAVAYLDGDLAILDPFADQPLKCFRANCQILAPSPNGRLLAAGGANVIIHIYEFDTLRLLYRVKSANSYIKQLAFTRDSMLLADIRRAQCTVWEPEALLRESLSDDNNGPTPATVVETVLMEANAKITAMAVHHTSEVVFCGKDDGSVVAYERKTAASLGTLQPQVTSPSVELD